MTTTPGYPPLDPPNLLLSLIAVAVGVALIASGWRRGGRNP